ncbi:hypothetical protein BD414DRAFT_474138 [Trametes punicea]|nr:hypothetical protein BD414DRAFT_474138 [Trametes punicea]
MRSRRSLWALPSDSWAFSAQLDSIGDSDGGTTNSPPSQPNAGSGGHSSRISPAIPVVVTLICLSLVALGSWWSLRRLRRSHRVYIPLLEMLGVVRPPELLEVRAEMPGVLPHPEQGRWMAVSPLSVTRVTAPQTKHATPRLPFPSMAISSASVCPPDSVTEHDAFRSGLATPERRKEPTEVVQVAVLIVMPSPCGPFGRNPSLPREGRNLPPLCLGVATVRCEV